MNSFSFSRIQGQQEAVKIYKCFCLRLVAVTSLAQEHSNTGVTSVQSPGKIFCSYIGYLKQTPALRRVKVSVLMRLILNDSQISDQSAPHDRPQSRALSCPTHCSQLTPLKSGGQLDLGEWEGYVAIARQVTT